MLSLKYMAVKHFPSVRAEAARHSPSAETQLFFQGYGIGLILRRLLIQQGDEFAPGSGNPNFAFADNLLGAEASAIELFVRTAVRPERRALERDAGEQSARARIREDLCLHDDVGIRRCCAALGPGRCGGIGAKLHFAAQDGVRAFGIHDQEYEIRGLTAQLKTDVCTFERE